MKRLTPLSLLLLCGVVLAVAGGRTPAAEQGQDPFAVFQEKASAVREQMYAKQMELQAEYASSAPDTEKVKRLYVEMGELQGQLFAARDELRNAAGGNAGNGVGGWGCPAWSGNGGGGWGCPAWSGNGGGWGRGRGMGGGWGRGRGGFGRGGHCW